MMADGGTSSADPAALDGALRDFFRGLKHASDADVRATATRIFSALRAEATDLQASPLTAALARLVLAAKRAMQEVLLPAYKETRKALNHPSIRFDDGTGVIKAGSELKTSDLEFGVCNVCKQVRAVAPTRHSKGFLHFACTDCHGRSYPAARSE